MTGAPALGIYVHWPYCARVCPYCDFNVVRDRGRTGEQADLVEAIAEDLRGHAGRLGPRRLASVFLGGGTPSLMQPDWAGRLIALARTLWPSDSEVEVTLEANPTDAESGRFAAFAAAGVDRLSLGVQALDDEALAFLGRNHDAAAARRAAAAAARAFPRLSLDLIYALPGQTLDGWRRTLTEADSLGAEHLSPYQLTIETGTAFGRAAARGRLKPVPPDVGADFYDATQSTLEALGYEAYEVSNHARGLAARSRHNLVYWRGEDYVGVGPGAHGRLTIGGTRLAVEAYARVGDYVAAVREAGVGWREADPLSPLAVAQERLLMGLRTVEGVGWDELTPLGLTPGDDRLAHLAVLGLVDAGPDRMRATAAGRLVLDRLTEELAC